MDFTIKIYRELLETIRRNGYHFQTFSKFLIDPADKVVILRHDVDARPERKEEGYQINKIDERNIEKSLKGIYISQRGTYGNLMVICGGGMVNDDKDE